MGNEQMGQLQYWCWKVWERAEEDMTLTPVCVSTWEDAVGDGHRTRYPACLARLIHLTYDSLFLLSSFSHICPPS